MKEIIIEKMFDGDFYEKYLLSKIYSICDGAYNYRFEHNINGLYNLTAFYKLIVVPLNDINYINEINSYMINGILSTYYDREKINFCKSIDGSNITNLFFVTVSFSNEQIKQYDIKWLNEIVYPFLENYFYTCLEMERNKNKFTLYMDYPKEQKQILLKKLDIIN